MKRIAPGAYVDDRGALHISVPELLQELGWTDTPETRAAAVRLLAEAARELLPDAKITQGE